MPRRLSRRARHNPEGPPPMMPICVRMPNAPVAWRCRHSRRNDRCGNRDFDGGCSISTTYREGNRSEWDNGGAPCARRPIRTLRLHRMNMSTRAFPNGIPLPDDGRRSFDFNPRRCVVACARPSAHVPVHVGVDEPALQRGVQQQMIDAQPRVTLPALAHVVPERVDRIARMAGAYGVGPARVEELAECRAALWLHKRVVVVRARRINVR